MLTSSAFPDYPPLSEDALAEALGYRESPDVAAGGSMEGLEATVLDRPWPDVISRKAYDFVVRWEPADAPITSRS